MRVLFDHQAFTGKLYGGIQRYFVDLMNEYAPLDQVSFDLSLVFSNSELLKDRPYASPVGYAQWAQNTRANQAASLLNRWYSSYRLCRQKFDVFHPTFYHPYFLEQVGNKPVVVTFHDALSEQFSEFPDFGPDITQRKKRCLGRADAIIAISEATKREMLKWFDLDESKIWVVHHGNPFSGVNLDNFTPKLSLPNRYILFVGERKFYKNFNKFFEAIAPILEKDRDLHLICAGQSEFDADEHGLFAKHRLSARVRHQPIASDDTLVELYRRAEVFGFPSLTEGFGFPIIEAMSCGCAIVASDGTSFNELALDAALYFDATDAESIQNAVETALYQEELRQYMIAKGLERAQHFSNKKTAVETLKIYQTLGA